VASRGRTCSAAAVPATTTLCSESEVLSVSSWAQRGLAPAMVFSSRALSALVQFLWAAEGSHDRQYKGNGALIGWQGPDGVTWTLSLRVTSFVTLGFTPIG